MVLRQVPLQLQQTETDCGIATMTMIGQYWGLEGWTRERVQAACPVLENHGARARDLRTCAREGGLECHLVHGSWEDLERELRRGHLAVFGLVKPTSPGRCPTTRSSWGSTAGRGSC